MFAPWIGQKWGVTGNVLGGIRLLILGQSHYTEHEEAVGTCDVEGTKVIVREWALEKPARFFTNITQIVSNRPKWTLSRQELEDIWAAVGFYNYVPVYAATGPRQLPTEEMFRSGAEPFERVLDQTKPQAVMVLGLDVWWWLYKTIHPLELRTYSNSRHMSYRGITFGRIKHPSAIGFSFSRERPYLEETLNRAAQISVLK